MSLTLTLYPHSDPASLACGEATNINIIVIALIQPRLEPTIFRNRDEHPELDHECCSITFV